jgi:hypothetical protein
LLDGAKPRIKTKSKNLIQVAQQEVKQRLIDYEIIQPKTEEFQGSEDEAFIGEELGIGEEAIIETSTEDTTKEKKKEKTEVKKKSEKKAKTPKAKTPKKKSSKKT